MTDTVFTVEKNVPLTGTVYKMDLAGDTAGILPGQFVNVAVPGFYLRRPISVCDREDGVLTLIYKIAGTGTDALSHFGAGQSLSILTGLGNGYDLTKAGNAPLLLGGGVGVAPLYLLAKRLRQQGKDVRVILGFNKRDEIFYEDAFRALGCRVTIATADGSYGETGFVTDALPPVYSHFYACGPLPMLKAVCRKTVTSGQISLEERMGCGFGACMGCTHRTREGSKRVCKEGPVFEKEALLWED